MMCSFLRAIVFSSGYIRMPSCDNELKLLPLTQVWFVSVHPIVVLSFCRFVVLSFCRFVVLSFCRFSIQIVAVKAVNKFK